MTCEDEREAAEVYNNHALKIIGPFAVLNELIGAGLPGADLRVADLTVADLTVAAGLDGHRPEAGGPSADQDPQ